MNYYYDSILKAAGYIENNLCREVDISEIARYTGFSQFHFMRIFKSILGYTVSEYVRRRKITEAAKYLAETDMRILDIALMFDYNSQEAFTRAFKEVFDVTPNVYRTNRLRCRNLEQQVISEELLQIKLSGTVIEPMIMEKGSFRIAGLKYEGHNHNHEIPKLWNAFCKDINVIPGRVDTEISYGLASYDKNADISCGFKYLAGFEVGDETEIPGSFTVRKVERSKYAVFPIEAIVETIQKSISRIYSAYIPNSGLRIRGDYDFEYYDETFKANGEGSRIYFYVPIED